MTATAESAVSHRNVVRKGIETFMLRPMNLDSNSSQADNTEEVVYLFTYLRTHSFVQDYLKS
jgi:hypothetical protein